MHGNMGNHQVPGHPAGKERHLRAGLLCGPGAGLGPQREAPLASPGMGGRRWDVWPEGWTMSLFLGPMLGMHWPGGGPAVWGTWDPPA